MSIAMRGKFSRLGQYMRKMIFQLVTPVGGLEEKSKTFWLLVQMLCHWATGDSWKLRLLIYNRRQNELVHFALNKAFSCCTDFKRRKYSFSSPIPSVQCCADVRATYRKQQTPQLWMEWGGEGCGLFCSLKLPYLSTMSQQLCRRL